MLLKNWVCFLVGVEPKDTTEAKSGRKKDLLLLEASKENSGDFPQSSVSLNSKIEGISNQGYMRIHKGAWAVDRIQALVD